MVAVVELHDATCKPEPQLLIECANWFKNNIALFNKYKKYLIINIANEWVKKTFVVITVKTHQGKLRINVGGRWSKFFQYNVKNHEILK